MKRRTRKLLIGVICVMFIGIWLYWGNTSIQSTRLRINSERIPQSFEGFTIVQVSDLHNASFGNQYDMLIQLVKDASPDLIAITGDLIDSNHTDMDKAIQFVMGVIDIAPVYYVTGNHEAWSQQYELLQQRLIDAGVVLMDDSVTTIKKGGSSIQLVGLKDPDFTHTTDTQSRERVMVEKLSNLVDQSPHYTILLAHRPELFNEYVSQSIDLVLTGHAHGGQVRIPFIGGIVAPDQGFFPKYVEGIYIEGVTNMVVSRGLGNSIIPLRVNNRPELVIITLNQ